MSTTHAPVDRPAEERIRAAVTLLMSVRRDSQRELGTVLGVSRQSAGHRLAGRSQFTAAEVEMVAQHYGVPLDVVFAGPAACLRFLADEPGRDLKPSYLTSRPDDLVAA